MEKVEKIRAKYNKRFDEGEKWITVNGAHIPVGKDGELIGKVGRKIEMGKTLDIKASTPKSVSGKAKKEAKRIKASTQTIDGDLYVCFNTKQISPSSDPKRHVRAWGKVVAKPTGSYRHVGDFGKFKIYSKGFWGHGDNESYGYEFVLGDDE